MKCSTSLIAIFQAGSALAALTKPTSMPSPSDSVEEWTERGEMLPQHAHTTTHKLWPAGGSLPSITPFPSNNVEEFIERGEMFPPHMYTLDHWMEPEVTSASALSTSRHHIPGPGPAPSRVEREVEGKKPSRRSLSTVYVTKPVHKSAVDPSLEIIGRAMETPAPTPVLDRREAKKPKKTKKKGDKKGDKDHHKSPKTKHPDDDEWGTPDDLCSPAWKYRFAHRWNGNKIALHRAMSKFCGNREWKGHLEDECDGYNDPDVADDEAVCTVDPKGVEVGHE
ncbi:hypothetical protein PRZ48_013938 [Zasmidium cellare]|uniref:Uncharacterized protein n=1 Tax=Zasmidium cellare TaxID=395010 RepID=A0ABR0DZL0_ZASCE|nr:hypothetical protein PRZ48_013938 [Zasmidium cellare]